MAAPSDLDLLRVEIETNWVRDGDGRIVRERTDALVPAPCLVVASSPQERHVEVGATISPAIGQRLEELLAAEPPVEEAARPPRCAEHCLGLVRSARPQAVVQETVCLVIDRVPPSPLDDPASPSAPATVVSSVAPESTEVRPLLPAGHVEESRGPWAAVVVGGRVASVCSTARACDTGVEAGTWTEPELRGRGYAAAATATWASLLLPSGRALFYSALGSNASSRAVASRLGLRPIGWMWKILPA